MSAWNDHSLTVAMQSAFGTANVTDADYDAQALLAEVPSVSFDTEVTELDLMTGQVGAAAERIIGRRSGTLGFKIPLEGFASDYDPGNDDPGAAPVTAAVEIIPLWLALLGNAMGSNNTATSSNANFVRGLHLHNNTYTAAGMASGTASTIVLDANPAAQLYSPGSLVVAALSDTNTAPQIGWVETKGDPSAVTLALFEAAVNDVNDNDANIYGTSTAYASAEITDTNPLGFRWTGPNTVLCYDLLDAIADNVKLSWESGEVPTAEFSFKFYDFRLNKADGGLVVPSSYTRIPKLIGSVNARATIDGDNQCGLEAASWEWSATHRVTKCHGSSSGISAVEVIKPRIKASFSIPHDTNDKGYNAAGVESAGLGQHVWQSSLELGTRHSLGCYVGSQVGRIWSFLIPSGLVTSVQVADRDGAVAYTVEVEAASYSADESDDAAETKLTCPINSIARVAVG